MEKKFRVAIVDDHSLFVDGFKLLLRKLKQIEVIGSYKNGEDYLENVETSDHDLVFMDINMSGIDGYETTKILFQKKLSIKVVVVTECTDGNIIDKFLRLGVSAYITKDTSWQELTKVLENIQEGKNYITPTAAINYALVSMKSSDKNLNGSTVSVSKKDFSEREIKLLRLLDSGKKEKEIAETLFISIKTVQKDKKRMASKLGVTTQSQIIAAAYRLKILP